MPRGEKGDPSPSASSSGCAFNTVHFVFSILRNDSEQNTSEFLFFQPVVIISESTTQHSVFLSLMWLLKGINHGLPLKNCNNVVEFMKKKC